MPTQVGESAFGRVEPQLGLPLPVIGPMALEAGIGKNRPDVAREVDRLVGADVGERKTTQQEGAERRRKARRFHGGDQKESYGRALSITQPSESDQPPRISNQQNNNPQIT